MPKISAEQIEQIKELYITEKISLAEISRKVEVCRPSVRKILREANLRNLSKEDYDNSRFINTKFFDAIDDEASAYFLGLMFADGNIYIKSKNKKYYSVSLCLAEADIEIVKKFKDLIAPKHILYKVPGKPQQQNCYKISFGSKIVSNQLINLGCTPNKSLSLMFPNIPDKLVNHFVRGYFDGDGCICSKAVYKKRKNKKEYINFKASFAGTKNFCNYLASLIENELSITTSSYTRRNGITTELSINGNRQVLKLKKWLYKDATFFMKRKYEKFKELDNFILTYF